MSVEPGRQTRHSGRACEAPVALFCLCRQPSRNRFPHCTDSAATLASMVGRGLLSNPHDGHDVSVPTIETSVPKSGMVGRNERCGKLIGSPRKKAEMLIQGGQYYGSVRWNL
jgi:hypothetical protein